MNAVATYRKETGLCCTQGSDNKMQFERLYKRGRLVQSAEPDHEDEV